MKMKYEVAVITPAYTDSNRVAGDPYANEDEAVATPANTDPKRVAGGSMGR